MFTKQQNDHKLNNEDVSTDETCRLFQNILGIPRMIKKPGNFGKSRLFWKKPYFFFEGLKLDNLKKSRAFSTKTAYPGIDSQPGKSERHRQTYLTYRKIDSLK